MGKIRFNTDLILKPAAKTFRAGRAVFNVARQPIALLFGGMLSAIIGGFYWGISSDMENQRQREEERQRLYQQSALSTKRASLQSGLFKSQINGRSYTLSDADTVVISSADLKKIFDFSVGKMFVIENGADETSTLQIIDFSEMENPHHVGETKMAGCIIADDIMNFIAGDIAPSDLEGAQRTAQAFQDLNCE